MAKERTPGNVPPEQVAAPNTVIIKGKETPLLQLVLVAVITAALTAALTTLVDRSKISGEHERWKKEQLISYQQARLQEQTQLIRQAVVSLIHLSRARQEFNYGFVHLIGTRILAQDGHKDVNPSEIEKQLNDVYARYLTHWAEARGQFRHARTVFGESVAAKINSFDAYFQSEKYLYDATQAPGVQASLRKALSQTKRPRWELDRISQDHSKPEGHQELMQHANELLAAMEAELVQTRKALLNNVLGTK